MITMRGAVTLWLPHWSPVQAIQGSALAEVTVLCLGQNSFLAQCLPSHRSTSKLLQKFDEILVATCNEETDHPDEVDLLHSCSIISPGLQHI